MGFLVYFRVLLWNKIEINNYNNNMVYIMINFCSFLFFFLPILKNEAMILVLFWYRHIWIKTSYKTPLLLYFLSDYIGYG